MDTSRRNFIVAFVAFTTLPVAMSLADGKRRRRGRHKDGHDDNEMAVKARKTGDVLPLREILDELSKTHKGDIVGIEFEKEDQIWVYEIKMVSAEGRYLEIYVDASTNKIIKVEGK